MADTNTVPTSFQQSLRLKHMMLRQIFICVQLFFWPKSLYYIFEGMQSQNQASTQQVYTIVFLLDTLNLIFLVVIFYPRKQWPDYFQLGLPSVGGA